MSRGGERARFQSTGPDNVFGVARRPWLIPVAAAVAAVAPFAAGVVVWRMTGLALAPNAVPCLADHGCAIYGVRGPGIPHRLHPLRAEMLWAASALFAVVAIGTSLRQWRRPGTVQSVTG